MKIILNGKPAEIAGQTLNELLAEFDYASKRIATAVNGAFVRRDQRDGVVLNEGDAVEILTPRHGG